MSVLLTRVRPLCFRACVRQLVYVCVFFFSSRRRHTRCSRDWSSDVCSSDLVEGDLLQQEVKPELTRRFGYSSPMAVPTLEKITLNMGIGEAKQNTQMLEAAKIGRASCRERV